MKSNLLSRYGLKFHPFRPDIPIEGLYTTQVVDSFCRRVEFTVTDGQKGPQAENVVAV